MFAHLVAIGLRDAEQLADDRRRQRERQVVDEIPRLTVEHRLEEVIDEFFDVGAQRPDSAGVERLVHQLAQPVVIIALLLLVWGWVKRERLFAPLTRDGEDPAARRPFRAGMVGALGGTVIGALANDSGPAILIIGTIYICMGLLYLRGRPFSGTIEE